MIFTKLNYPGVDLFSNCEIGILAGTSHKTEHFSCQWKAAGAEQFDEAGFISALKQDVENEIKNSGAKIVESGKPETNSFYFEYTFENVKGRIEVLGSELENHYNLKAD